MQEVIQIIIFFMIYFSIGLAYLVKCGEEIDLIDNKATCIVMVLIILFLWPCLLMAAIFWSAMK